MQDLLLIALILGAGYFLIIQPPKPAENQSPITHSQSTQTEPLANDNQELEATIDTLLQNIKQLNHQLK